MSKKGVMLIDCNSVGHACNAATKLTANGIETQAIFGVLKSVRDLKLRNDGMTPIGLWDGRSERRYSLYPEYKVKRQLEEGVKPKPYQVKQEALRASYKLQRPHIIEGLRLLGVKQILPTLDEADDFAGVLSKVMTERNIKTLLVSRDHDWLQLVNEFVSWFNPIDGETVNHATFQEYTGYATGEEFLEEKALVGDSSDNIKGVAGIGEKCAPIILSHYGCVKNLLVDVRACQEAGQKWVPPIKDLNRYKKKINDFAKCSDVFDRNIKLMDLLNGPKPQPGTFEVIKPELDEEGFIEFCREFNFSSIINHKEEWLFPFTGV